MLNDFHDGLRLFLTTCQQKKCTKVLKETTVKLMNLVKTKTSRASDQNGDGSEFIPVSCSTFKQKTTSQKWSPQKKKEKNKLKQLPYT